MGLSPGEGGVLRGQALGPSRRRSAPVLAALRNALVEYFHSWGHILGM